jgi:hypothetical protein
MIKYFIFGLNLLVTYGCQDMIKNIKSEGNPLSMSGFYQEKNTKSFFYRCKYYGEDKSLQNEGYIIAPVLKINGDTVKNIDIETFKIFGDFYTDKNYVFKVTRQADFLEIIAEPIKSLVGCYYEQSYYTRSNDTIFYYSDEGKACNGFTILNSNTVFEVLDIASLGEDCATIGDSILLNGCILSRDETREIDNEIFLNIMSAISENKIKTPICFSR